MVKAKRDARLKCAYREKVAHGKTVNQNCTLLRSNVGRSFVKKKEKESFFLDLRLSISKRSGNEFLSLFVENVGPGVETGK